MYVPYKEKCFARRAGLLGFIGIISFVLYPVNAQSLNDAQIDLISARLADSALLRWGLLSELIYGVIKYVPKN